MSAAATSAAAAAAASSLNAATQATLEARVIAAIQKPFKAYSKLLDTQPIITKATTNGLMYLGGDLIAQRIEYWQAERELLKKARGETAAGDGSLKGLLPVTEQERREAEEALANRGPFRFQWDRAGVMLTWGLFIAGPIYHLWFDFLDTAPQRYWALRNARQRAEILRAFNVLRRHGIKVDLKMDRIPSADPLGKWTQKAVKVLLDQAVFSSLYTLGFFVGTGMMKGGLDNFLAERRLHDIEDFQTALHKKFGVALPAISTTATGPIPPPSQELPQQQAPPSSWSFSSLFSRLGGWVTGSNPAAARTTTASALSPLDEYSSSTSQGVSPFPSSPAPRASPSAGSIAALPPSQQRALEKNLLALRQQAIRAGEVSGGVSALAPGSSVSSSSASASSSSSSSAAESEAVASIDRVLAMLKEEQNKKTKTWHHIWDESYHSAKDKFLVTYLLDCAVWPLLQTINFTFVPLKAQVLFVSMANLGWNTVLSLMAHSH